MKIPFDPEKLQILLHRDFHLNTDSAGFYTWYSDFSNIPLIFPHIVSMESLDSNVPFGVGKIFQEKAKNLWGKEENVLVKIVQVNPGKDIWVRAENPRRKYYFHFEFLNLENGHCTFSWKFLMPRKSTLTSLILKVVLGILFKSRLAFAEKKLAEIFPLHSPIK